MTEYDYSPAAYERYLAQQTRVSNWVSDTLSQSHAWSDPFVLSPTLRDRSFYDGPDRHPARHHRPDDWSTSSSRPSRTRSRSHTDHNHYDRAPSRHRSQSHSRSASQPRDFDIVYQPHASQPYGYSQPHVVARTPAPRHNYQYPSQSGYSPNRPSYATHPPPGQIYHVSPNHQPPAPAHRYASHSRQPSKPPPQPYFVVQGGGPTAEYKRGPPIHAPVPTKPHNNQQPLLRRLLGFVSPVGGRSGNGRGYRGY